MEKTLSFFKISLALLLGAAFAVSCVDKSYDIGNLDKEITIGGENLTLPLVSTNPLYLGDLLSDFELDDLQTLSDGSYAFSAGDSFNLSDMVSDLGTSFEIKGVNFSQKLSTSIGDFDKDDFSVPATSFGYNFSVLGDSVPDITIEPMSNKATVGLKLFKVNLPGGVGGTVDLNVTDPVAQQVVTKMSLADVTLPDYVKSISNVVMAGEPKIVIDITVPKSIPGSVININSMTITFPPQISIAEADPDGKVTLPAFNASEGAKLTYTVAGFDPPALVDHKLKMDADVVIDLVAKATGIVNVADMPSGDDDDLVFEINITSEEMSIGSYQAEIEEFQQSLPSSEQDFSFPLSSSNDALAKLGDVNVILDQANNPAITISPNLPATGVKVVAAGDGLRIKLPDMFTFGAVPAAYNFKKSDNSITIKGEIPQNIVIPINMVRINATQNEKGEYVVEGKYAVSGTIKAEAGTITKADIDKLAGDISMNVGLSKLVASEIAVSKLDMDYDKDLSFTVFKKGDIPEMISQIKEIELEDVFINLAMNIDKMPDLGKNAGLFFNADITLPDLIVLEDGGHTIHVNKQFKNNSLSIEPVKVAALDFSKVQLPLKKDYEAVMNLVGNFTATNLSLASEDLNGTFDVSVNGALSDIKIKKIVGNVSLDIDPVEKSFELEGLPDIFKEEGTVIDFYNPYLLLDLKSNAAIPLSGTATLIPVIGGKDQRGISVDIEMPYAASASSPAVNKYFIAALDEGRPADYTYKKADLGSLIKKVPDSIKISVEASVDSNKDCVFEADAKYDIAASYKLVIPFQFGKDLNISLKNTLDVSSMSETLSSILENAAIELAGEVKNSIPLQLQLNLVPLDAQGNAIPLSKPATQTISACNSDGSASSTPLALTLAPSGKVTSIKSLDLDCKVTSAGVSGVPITKDCYLQLDIKVKLPNGITVNLGNLK